jgi:5-methyltetrahydrofolate--homocysteine methyltransferase
MLYGRHLGLKGSSVRLLEKAQAGDREAEETLRNQEPKAIEVWQAVESVKKDYAQTNLMKPRALWRFFKATSQGNSIQVYRPNSEPLLTFEFPRQKREDGLCLADYTHPLSRSGTTFDTVAFFVVSVGIGVRDEAEKLKQAGRYLESHILQVLALESAEAYAELLHGKLRALWGFPDAPEMTHMQRFQAKYRGKRYSFGYPACPRLDDQALLWKLLEPQQIEVELTDGFMMDPEASVSAIVFHHPEATYFSVGNVTGPGGTEENRS